MYIWSVTTENRSEEKEKRASEVVGNCCYLLVTVVFKKKKKTRGFHVAVVGLSVSVSDMPYGPPPYTVTLISLSLSLFFLLFPMIFFYFPLCTYIKTVPIITHLKSSETCGTTHRCWCPPAGKVRVSTLRPHAFSGCREGMGCAPSWWETKIMLGTWPFSHLCLYTDY